MKQIKAILKDTPWEEILLFVASAFCGIVFIFLILILLMGLK